MIIADTSGLLAFYNAREPSHEQVRTIVEGSNEQLAVSPYVIAELDYLVATRIGTDAALAVLDELSGGAYELANITPSELADCSRVIEGYRDQDIGVADASLVVLAAHYSTRTILTLDRRHFTVLRPLDGGRFKLLPA